MGTIEYGIKGMVKGPNNTVQRKLNRLKPKWITVMTTELCNSRCTMCNIWQNKKTHEPLSPEEIKKTLGDPLFKDVDLVLNTGGESTTRADLKEFLMAEHEALPKATIVLGTNSLLPERAYNAVKYLLEHNVRVDVGLSVDGIGELLDKIRGVPGNFEKLDWLLHKLVELRQIYGKLLSISAGTVLMDDNLKNYLVIKKYLDSMGVGHVLQCYNSTQYYRNETIKASENKDEIRKIVKAQPKNVLIDKWLKVLDGKSIKYACFAMHKFCVLKSNGDMVPCWNLWNQSVGNVREKTPTEIWSSQASNEARKIVSGCNGCMNSCAVSWSAEASFFPLLVDFIKHRKSAPISNTEI
jgi:MoaA/NifB/PqqE/SkfB family radical SAM enzyme